jgi:hypothetical protein
VAQAPYVIEQPPRGAGARLSLWLRGRRLLLAALLALAEVVALIVWRPSVLLAVAAAAIVLVLAVMGATRLPRGVGRDLLWIVALAQGLVVVLPLVLTISLVAGLLVAALLLAALVVVALRLRV